MKHNLILFYPSFERGGVEKIIQNLIENNKKFKIHLVSSKNALKFINKKKFKFNFIEVSQKIKIPFFPERFSSAINGMLTLFYYLNNNKDNYLIHSMQSNVAAIITSIFKRKKIIIRNSENPIHSLLYSENKFFSIISIILKYIFYNFADAIITNSYGSGRSLEFFVFNKKKIKPIYNPYLKTINKKKFKKKNYLITIGRLRKQKDQKTLIEAFKIFSEKNQSYKLVILGNGNLEKKLKMLAKDLNINNKIVFKGWIKNTTRYLKHSKIFVLSSVFEGLGNVLIDAVNYNIPCVSTDCPSGPSEILLNGKGGYLVRPRSPIQLAEKIQYSINNYSNSLKKNSIAKKKINRFLISKQTKKYFDYLSKFY
jgi:glycosyltransferase involved in cell wall biosynthesis